MFAAALFLATAPGALTRMHLQDAQPRRIVLVGLDGADWLAIDPLIAAGRLPTFARLRTLGRTGVMVTTPPLVSPMIWTSIATGLEPENHGVLDFMVDRPGGGQMPVGSPQRLAPAIWNLFSAAGRTVAVVGWWATWPAERVNGTIVSDALAPQLERQTIGTAAGVVSPAGAHDRIAAAIVRPERLTREDLSAYVPLTDRELERIRSLPEGDARYRDPIAHLAQIAAATRTYTRVATSLAQQDRPDLVAAYLESIDSVSHLFVRDERRGRQAIARAYEDADALLNQIAQASAPDTLIVVCSDHGFYPPTAAIREDPANLAGPATAWHRPYGIVGSASAASLATGRVSAALAGTADVGLVTPLDIAPTLLHAAGLAVSSEMPGRVMTALLPASIAARPVIRKRPPPYAPPAPATAALPETDAAAARLRALGYIGSTTTSLARRNLAESLFRRGKYAAAERELRAVLESRPQDPGAQLWLAQTLARTNRAPEALRIYERAMTLPGAAEDALVEATELAATSGDLEAARRMIGAAPAASSVVHTARGIVAETSGDARAAEREYRQALALEPTSFDAAARLSDVLKKEGRTREALAPVERALSLAPDSPRLLGLAGDARLTLDDVAGAERAFVRALQLAPDADTLRIALARTRLAAKQPDRAIDALNRAAPSPDRDTLLGAAYAATHDWRKAIEHLQAAMNAGRSTPEILNSLGWAHLQLGDRSTAASFFNRSLAAKPDQPEIRRLLRDLGASRDEARARPVRADHHRSAP